MYNTIARLVAPRPPLATSCGSAGTQQSSGSGHVSTRTPCHVWCPKTNGQLYYSMGGFVQSGIPQQVSLKLIGLNTIIIFVIFLLASSGAKCRFCSRTTTSWRAGAPSSSGSCGQMSESAWFTCRRTSSWRHLRHLGGIFGILEAMGGILRRRGPQGCV